MRKVLFIFCHKILVVTIIIPLVLFVVFQCKKEKMENSVKTYKGNKILFVNSYHKGYEWSDGILNGIEQVLSATEVTLKVHYMDTKLNTSEEFMKEAAIKAKNEIETFKPDVIIVADDNAFMYLVMEYYRDAELPIVFCGVNWDLSMYGGPYSNTTGMLEVDLVAQTLDYLYAYAKGRRIGILGDNTYTSKKEIAYYRDIFKLEIYERHVTKFDDFKTEFIDMQKKVDVVILLNYVGIRDWDTEIAKKFIHENTVIPTGAFGPWMMPYCLLGVPKIPEEPGEFVAQAALKIIDGIPPSEIPITKNKKEVLMLNLEVAKKLNIEFSSQMLKIAVIVE